MVTKGSLPQDVLTSARFPAESGEWSPKRDQTLPFGPADRVGLLAGAGLLPVRVAESARAHGVPVVCLALAGLADEDLRELCAEYHVVSVARLGRILRLLKQRQTRYLVMAGKVWKHHLFDRWRFWKFLPDLRTIRLYLMRCRGNRKDDQLLLAVTEEFQREGIEVRSPLELCPQLLAPRGCLSKRPPTSPEWEDICFGWRLAKEIGRLDIGQTVAVKECAVLAVEAIEGTDRAILRAGELCPMGGFTVVKVAKPQQDMRFDVPTIGPQTIETLRQARARVLAIEAGKTILLEQQATLEAADRYGISVVALRDEDLLSAAPPNAPFHNSTPASASLPVP